MLNNNQTYAKIREESRNSCNIRFIRCKISNIMDCVLELTLLEFARIDALRHFLCLSQPRDL